MTARKTSAHHIKYNRTKTNHIIPKYNPSNYMKLKLFKQMMMPLAIQFNESLHQLTKTCTTTNLFVRPISACPVRPTPRQSRLNKQTNQKTQRDADVIITTTDHSDMDDNHWNSNDDGGLYVKNIDNKFELNQQMDAYDYFQTHSASSSMNDDWQNIDCTNDTYEIVVDNLTETLCPTVNPQPVPRHQQQQQQQRSTDDEIVHHDNLHLSVDSGINLTANNQQYHHNIINNDTTIYSNGSSSNVDCGALYVDVLSNSDHCAPIKPPRRRRKKDAINVITMSGEETLTRMKNLQDESKLLLLNNQQIKSNSLKVGQ